MLREFAQGAAQSAVQPVADFLAPTVEVPTSIGRYKIYTEKNRFAPPDTSRAIGGRATVLSFDATDATYNCQPNALDFPIDYLEQIEEAALTNALMEGATIVAEVAALVPRAERDQHRDRRDDRPARWPRRGPAAAAAIRSTTSTRRSSTSSRPRVTVRSWVSACFSAPGPGDSSRMRPMCAADSSRRGITRFPNVTPAEATKLFVGNPEVRTSYMVVDTTKEGLAPEHQLPARHVGADFRAAAESDAARSVVHEDVPADGQLYGARLVPARRRPRGGGEVRLERGRGDHE